MNKYAQVATNAISSINTNPELSPIDAWNIEAAIMFGEGTSSYKKGCPKNAFLGLCESGIIKGIPSGSYTNSTLNKEYAIKAIDYLKTNTGFITPSQLWSAIGMDHKKT